MFTGIIEEIGEVIGVRKEGTNLIFEITSSFLSDIKIDQSIAHNGVCLTVTNLSASSYFVEAISETLHKTNLSSLQEGSKVNLERCLKLGDRLDGHMVQGHVDTVAECVSIKDENGSWRYTFVLDSRHRQLFVNKGSICVNGVSLTVVDPKNDEFSVAIIPYTYEHTNFNSLLIGDFVNIEFDILGKYINQGLEAYNLSPVV